MDLPDRTARTRRTKRVVALATIAALVMSVGAMPTAAPGRDGFPLDVLHWFLDDWRSTALPMVGGLPEQARGGQPGPHHVPVDDTSAHRGSGRAPGTGIGALPAYVDPSSTGGRLAGPSTTPTQASDASFDPERSKRIVSAATETSDIYVNPDGSYTRKVYQQPVNFRAKGGEWTPIDSTLVRGGDGRYRQKANAVSTDLAARADDPRLAELLVDDAHGLSYALAGARGADAQVDGDTVVYPGVLPGVDLMFETRASGTKESIVLHSADAPTSYLFPLRLRGLAPVLESDGSVTLRDSAGAIRVTIPAGYMTDSRFDTASGSFTRSNAVRYELVEGPALRVTIDGAWLRDKDRVFPVTVDPTVALDGSGDTYAYSTQTGNNSGDNELLVGTWNGSAKAYSFIHFDTFGASFGGAKMTGVSLKIFDSWASTCTAKPFSVNPISVAWTNASVSSYPGPAFGASIGSVTANPGAACTNTAGDRSVGTWMTVPLSTATFQDWALGGVNNGLAITASQTDITQWKRFTSLNGPAGLGPYLQVTYTAGMSPQVDQQFPPHGYAVPSLTPELLVAAHDPDAFPKALTYDFAVYDKNGTKLVESGWISSRSWIVPAGTLAWGQAYSWTVIANDGYSTSVSQTVNAFSTPVPQPLITSGLAQNGGQGFEPSVANYTTSATDASVETIGPSLAVTRSYNSQDPRVGFAFGAGWSSVADMKAIEQRDNDGTLRMVMVTYPGGQDVVFGRNPDGTFAPPMGRFATFSAVSGGYRLVDKDGTTYVFAAATGTAGQFGLSSIADAQGRTETFGYDGSGRLTTMTAASGRALRLTWSTPAGATAPHVASVSTDGDAATAQTWQYGYSGDLLTKVCPPTSATACTTYTYGTGSLYPTTVMNADPRSYWRLAEAAGDQAASAVLDNYGTDVATYHGVARGPGGPLPGSAAGAASFDGATSYVELPAQLVSTATYMTVGLWFKANAGDQGPLFSYQADPIGNGTTSGNYTPALYVGTSGKLYGQFWDGGAVPMSTSGSVTDGQWHHVVLSGAGGRQWLYLDGALVGTKSGQIQTINSYSAANEYLGAGFLGGDWPDEPNSSTTSDTGYASYFKGSISDAVYFDRSLTAADVSALYRTATGAARPLTSIVRPSGNASAVVAYDAVSGAVTQVTDANGGVWKLNQPKVSGSSKVYASTVLGADAADYWRLAETGTSDAINEVNGTVATYDGVTLGVSGGPFADATVAGFDGTRSNLRLSSGYLPAAGPHSVSMWFKTTTTNRTLFSYQADPITTASTPGNFTPALYVGSSGKLLGQFWKADGGMFTSTKLVNDGQWHHVALAAGASSQSMYLDGELVGTKTGTVAVSGQNNVYVGAGFLGGKWPDQNLNTTGTTTGYPTYFKGQIAEVAFYRSQLTAAQVAAQYGARDAASGTPAKTVTITDPTNKTITHVYDVGTGRELSETDTLGGQTKYGYDEGGFLRTVTDPNGNVTTTEHDVRGNTVSSTTCQDRSANKCSTVYFTYYPDATTKVLTPDPRNDVMLTMRDGRSASATDNTYLTSYTYDGFGNRTAVTDPLGRVTRTAYTDGTTIAAFDGGLAPPGLPMTVTTAGGAVQTVVYYRSGDVAKVTDPAGKVTTYTYDALGRALTMTEKTDSFPSGLVTSYQYDKLDRVVSQTDPPTTNRVTGAVHTQVTTVTYNVDGLVTSTTLADATGGDASRTETTTYNTIGQPASVTDAAGKVTRFEYDVYGNPVKEVDADGGEVGSAFDPEGNLLSSTLLGFTGDPNNPGPATNLVVEARAYDPAGRLASRTDAMGWVTSYTYTDNGLPAKTTRKDPASGATFVLQDDSYDAAGNLVKRVTGNGTATTAYTVDAAGRPATSTFDPAGLKRTSTYTYSRDDQVVGETLTDPTGLVRTVDTMYDKMGRVIAETTHNSAMTPVARYRLDQSASDSAGNNTGTASGVTWSPDRGGAGTFNGTSSAITTAGPPLDSAAGFTVSAWVNLADSGAVRKAVSGSGAQQDAFELRYDTDVNRWRFAMKGTDTARASEVTVASTSAPVLNTWTHLTGVYDAASGAMRLYVNGTLQGSATVAGTFTAGGPLLIGAGIADGTRGNFWAGGISDVQLYSRVLTVAEISAVTAGTAPAADAGVVRTSYQLDQNGLARSMTDPNGNVTNFDYDEAGRLTVTTGPAVMAERNGGTPLLTRPVTLAGFDTFGEQVEEVDANGNLVATGYDAEGRELWTKLPSYTPPGTTTVITPTVTNAYDSLGQLTSSTDPLGRTTQYAYDQLGRLAKVTQPNTGVRTLTYDAVGDQLSDTDATGARTAATYDYLGRMVTSTDAVRQTGGAYTTNYTYGTNGLLASEKSPAGTVVSTTYNAAGEPVTVTDTAGNTTTYAYDGAGQRIRTTLPDGTFSTVTYDLAGRPVTETEYDAAGTQLRRTSNRYDPMGNVVASTDPRGTTTTFGYDPTGLVTSEVQPISASDSITTRFGYDPNGNRTRFTDGRGNAFLTTYNAWDLPESTIEPSTTAYPNLADRSFTITYDANGQATKAALPGGASVALTYDTMGSLTRQTGTGAEVATAERTFGYDLAGRLTTATAQGGTNTFSYDDRGLLLSASGPSGSSAFTYTADGLMASRADAAGTTSYGYDTAGRLATIANSTANVQATLGYNNLSQVKSVVYGTGGNTRTLGYDPLHRLVTDELKTSGGTTVGKISYGYDVNDNETSKTTTGFAGSAANTYTYDLADRITSWGNGTTSTVYAYDKAGNRVQAGSRTFAYDQRNQLLNSSDGTTYQYTARGTLKATITSSDGSLATQSDAFGQALTQYAPGGLRQTYTYDAFGRALLPGFAYTGPGNDLAADDTNTYTRDPVGDLVGAASGSVKRLAWTDLHDDVVGQFDPTGATLAGSTTYDPLGAVVARAGMIGNLGYQSEWTDNVTGRVNMAARWYNTGTGQFDSRDSADVDPVPSSVSANRFAYADDNPLTVTDPTGHWGIPKFIKKAAQVVKRAAVSTVRRVVTTVRKVVNTVRKVVKNVVRKVKKVVHSARKWVAHKVAQVKRKIKQVYHRVKQAGKVVVAKVKRAVKKAAKNVSDAYHASAKWVKDHKNAIIEIAAIGAGILGGLACTAATGGVGAVACMAGAAALINVAKDAAQGNIHNLGDVFQSAGTGALQGVMGSVGGVVGGRLAVGLVSKLGPFAGSFVGRTLAGGVTAGAGDAVTQFLTTGRVNLKSVAFTAGIGAVFGGASKFAKTNGGGASRGGPEPGRTQPKSTSGGGSSCRHSFAPDTLVLMANGSKRPIKDVNVGDRVLATDPATGRTTARTVELLHRNRDRDLTDVTVEGGGRTAVIHTTQHHPFWDATTNRWRDAADLEAGASTLVDPAGRTLRVVAVRNFAGEAEMRDLTVANFHTYYVIAGDAPVLVHNCTPDLQTRNDMAASGMLPGRGGKASTTQAGLEYDKHQLMPGQVSSKRFLPRVGGNTDDLDRAGQMLLDDIAFHPRGIEETVTGGAFAGGTRIIRPDGVGAVFDTGGAFKYFGSFRYPG
ncbi:LamG-like jellyroll fold domain-containing protein [Dactylosporangium sp. AC04546]|uniref:LamG-like jellyroll fold domain-containing protein n=1 Tax=Dactylosporangium sp. AC04546 TaxID=2862460 RepID=UPI002E7B12F4|nr:LamG-like jellyroll fold domain-containing protein [Dactylosporangium sp. AC04546]WVK88741.1 LamG-like jellyroll fold domain-containing protein [Dactylosporangium sp. AC04546]